MNISASERPATCEQHGDYTERGIDFGGGLRWFGCKACAVTAQADKDAAAAAEATKERIRKIGIPSRHAFSTLKTFTEVDAMAAKALNEVRSWIDLVMSEQYQGEPLTMAGDAGRGKTHLACGALKKIASLGRDSIYTKAAEIEKLARGFEHLAERREALEKVRFLCIDELGMETKNEFSRAAVSQVLHARYDAMLPTIIVTNLGLDAIGNFYGQGIADRYVRDAFTLTFTGQSMRGAA